MLVFSGIQCSLYYGLISKGVDSTATLFNQYRDSNPDVDVPTAAAIRLANLRSYLERACESASILIVGEAAGPWGARFSGVPFVGEKQLLDPRFPICGGRSSLPVPLREMRLDPPFVSLSARLFWEVLLPFHDRIVVWDAVPFHTHKPDDALTVRNPSREEVVQHSEALRLIEEYVQPSQVVAVGRRAFGALETLGKSPVYVRHPSQGGIRKFAEGMQELFSRRP
ncbi:MAG TPA: uracil-DNA glycosylase [Planctomycetota bacterium]|nr:uracil-DNA glycosylase [Planctomycetota bacterium]